jgi:hypothetical protein
VTARYGRRVRRRLRRLLLLVVAVGLAGACSGDTDSGATATTGTIPAADRPFCDAFGQLLDGPLAEAEVDIDAADPEVLRTAVEQTQGFVDALRAAAPADIADAADAVADDYDATFAVLERYGYDLARVQAEGTPEELAALGAVGQPPSGPDVEDPYAVLTEFMGERCSAGVTIPPDLVPTTEGG